MKYVVQFGFQEDINRVPNHMHSMTEKYTFVTLSNWRFSLLPQKGPTLPSILQWVKR